jgi:hypothetical protein
MIRSIKRVRQCAQTMVNSSEEAGNPNDEHESRLDFSTVSCSYQIETNTSPETTGRRSTRLSSMACVHGPRVESQADRDISFLSLQPKT